MLSLVAAMRQEISIVLALCACPQRLAVRGVAAWQSTWAEEPIHLVRTGIGPTRAALHFRNYLAAHRPSRILIIGYGGALDPALRVGDLVAVRQVSSLKANSQIGISLEQITLDRSWQLNGAEQLVRIAEAVGLRAMTADAVTSRWILGMPAQKNALHTRFGAAVIDMESAAIAEQAAAAGIPVSCVRAISDEAAHEFLAPFSHVPGSGAAARALRVAAAGKWWDRYRTWRECSESAGRTLSTFVAEYLAHE